MRFFVGEEKSEYILHARLVSRQSKALEELVRAHHEDSIMWPDVSPKSFVRFSQYLYTGDYEAPLAGDLIEVKTRQVRGGGAGQAFKFESRTPTPKYPDKMSPQAKVWQAFQDRKYMVNADAPKNMGVTSDYGAVFVLHAKMNCFANEHGIRPLAILALQKLHSELCMFELNQKRVKDVYKIVKFSYDHGTSALQELVSAYASSHAEMLWACEDFHELLSQYPKLSRAMMDTIVRHLN